MKTPRSIRKSPFILQRTWSPVALLLCLAAQSSFADSTWIGGTSTDWSNAANWSAGVPTGTNAIINTSPANIATITANVPGVVDIIIGNGAGTNGRVNETAGTLSTGTGNWMFVGEGGGTGTFNLANTATTGGPLTGFGLGSGSVNVGGTSGTAGRLYIGGQGGTGTGTFNMNTTGTVTVRNDLDVGNGGTGVLNIDAGTMTTGGWNFIGDNGGSGNLNMSGGQLTNTGRTYVGGGTAKGRIVMSGGTYQNTADRFTIGNNNLAAATASSVLMTGGTINAARFTIGGDETNTGKGFMEITGATAQLNASNELWVGQGAGSRGLLNVTAGTVTSSSWLAVGRTSATGVLNVGGTGNVRMTGGNAVHIVIGSVGGTGILNMSGNGILEATNGGELRLSENGAGSGTANLNGGTLKVDRIADTGATSYLYMNGGTMQARIATTTYLQGLDNAVVGSAHAIFDTNGNNITVNQSLAAPTGSGVTSIPVTGAGAGYLGQPIVQLTGGGGTGATAVAVVTGGVITGITITNPGIGYTSAPTVTINDGGFTTTATLGTPVIAANTATGGVVKTGSGTLTLGSTNNSYGGSTTITGGTLSVASLANGGVSSTLGASTSAAANLVFNGGTLQYTGGSTSLDRNWTANAGQSAIFDVTTAGAILTLTGGGAATSGGLTKIGSGTLSLTGTSSYTGTTNANAGVLAASGTYPGGFAVGNGGHLTALSLAEGTLTVPTLSLAAGSNVDFEFGALAALSTGHDIINISSASGLALNSTGLYLYQTGGTMPFTANGTFTLFGYNTAFTGTLATAFTIANSQIGKLYNIVNSGTTIDLSIADTVITSWATDGGGLWTTGANWTAGVPNSFGAIATFGSVLTAGNAPATVTVSGPKTVGVIVFDNANSYILSGGAGDTITLNNGSGTPLISQLSGSHTIAAPLALIAATNVASAAGTTLTISGNISGAGSLNVTDAGTVTLAGTNTYGSTALNNGFLNVGSGGTTGSLGTGAVTLGTGTLLTFNRSDAISVANNISGTGALTQAGAGTLTYSGTATHTGATVFNNGTFISDGILGNLSGATSSLDVENATTLRNTSSTRVVGPVSVAATPAVTASLDVQNAATFVATGAVTVGAGAGSTGTLNIANTASVTVAGLTVGNNGGSGTLNVSGGTLGGTGINIGGNSTGTFNLTGGSVTATTFHVGQNTGGNGTVNMSAGTLTATSWSVVGQGGGTTGVFNMSGGIWNQNHTDILTVGENGAGTFTMTGSSLLNDPSINPGTGQPYVDTTNRNTNKGNVYVGRNNGGVGVWNIGDTAVAHIRELMVGNNAGSDGTVNIGGTALVDSSYDFHIGRAGTGVVNINGGTLNTTSGWTQVGIDAGGNGTLNVAGGSISSREYLIGGAGTGTVNVSAGTLTATQSFRVGEGAAGTGFLNVSGTGVTNMNNNLYVGYNGIAVANISGNAVVNVTNVFGVGYFGTSQGSVTQSGGTVNPGGGGDWRVGGVDTTAAAAVGIYTLTGGTFNTNHNFQIGAYGNGLMSVGGAGTVSVTGGFPVVGRFAGGFGVLDVTAGGTFTEGSGNRLIIGEEGTGTLNVRGGTVTSTSGNTTLAVELGLAATGNGTLNLLGGTLSTLSIGTAAGSSALNLNGGTLQANGSNPTFLQGLTKASVYSGGAVIDTQANSVTIAQALLAPTGSGLTTIPVSSVGAGYQAAPIVKISGGGGTGATAVATLDNMGQVSGIIITNPGTDYTSAPAVTLIGGAPTTAAGLGTATFATNVSGGLTKNGTGTLTLSGVNTYTGLTTVSNGTLALTGGAAIADTGAVTVANVAAATLLLNNSETIGSLSGGGVAGGTVSLGANMLTTGDASTTTFAGTITGAGGQVIKQGAGTFNITGTQTYSGLTTTAGTTNVYTALGTGTSTLTANATTKIYASQTLASLTIGAGATVTFGNGLPFAPEPAKFGAASGVVPEPGSLGLLMVGGLGMMGRRRRSV